MAVTVIEIHLATEDNRQNQCVVTNPCSCSTEVGVANVCTFVGVVLKLPRQQFHQSLKSDRVEASVKVVCCDAFTVQHLTELVTMMS